MNAKLIVIDGKSYHSVDEMPPDIRQKYDEAMRALGDADENPTPDAFVSMNIFADRDKNGVPDILEVQRRCRGRQPEDRVDGKGTTALRTCRPKLARYEAAMGKLDSTQWNSGLSGGMTNTTIDCKYLHWYWNRRAYPQYMPASDNARYIQWLDARARRVIHTPVVCYWRGWGLAFLSALIHSQSHDDSVPQSEICSGLHNISV
jgi:hypothetical protein